MNGDECRTVIPHASFGNTLCATDNIPEGKVIIKERPLICVPAGMALTDGMNAVARETGCATQCRRAQVFAQACNELRDGLLSLLHIPDVHADELKDTDAAKACLSVASRAAQPLDISEHKLLQGLLAFAANAHGYRGGEALYETGSKLTHTCGPPNTRYITTEDGFGCHTALTDIPKGDVLTTTYIGKEHALMSAPCRQRNIRNNFLFTCQCKSCKEEVDMYRGLPCPCCLPSSARTAEGQLIPELASIHAHLPGVVFFHPQRAATGKKPWVCSTCHEAFEDDARTLGMPFAEAGGDEGCRSSWPGIEEQLEQQVIAHMAIIRRVPSKPPHLPAWKSLLHECCSSLGPAHWAPHRMSLITAECSAAKLEGMADLLPHIASLPMGKDCCTEFINTLNEVQTCVEGTLGWLDSIPASPARRSTADLTCTPLWTIAAHLVQCALKESLPQLLEDARCRMASLAQGCVSTSLGSHIYKGRHAGNDAILAAMADPSFCDLCRC
uniref:Cadmium resistance protein 1 n=1 Tax=Dunaliella viridis TaxID=140095 RepID=A0A0U2SXA9_9CHLO|nr:cadmium resistance protein 1 [Dunaliella viridis]